MMNFEQVIDEVIERERGFSDHKNDSGGKTKDGITEAVARANGWEGPMEDLPDSLIRSIYRNKYIVKPQFDKICLIDEAVGFELIDTGVNMGPERAATFLQRWLNGFNKQGSRYKDVEVDGHIGEQTIAAFRAYRRWRGSEGAEVLRYALNCSQGAKYLEFAENRETQEDFLYGWVRSRVFDQLKGTV